MGILAVTRHGDKRAGLVRMFELVVLATADLLPTVPLEPSDDLAGVGLDRRHKAKLHRSQLTPVTSDYQRSVRTARS
jgi:hypothetical protein